MKKHKFGIPYKEMQKNNKLKAFGEVEEDGERDSSRESVETREGKASED